MHNKSKTESSTTNLNTELGSKPDWMSLAKKWSKTFSEKHKDDSVEVFTEWMNK